jgi:hypothetical protein
LIFRFLSAYIEDVPAAKTTLPAISISITPADFISPPCMVRLSLPYILILPVSPASVMLPPSFESVPPVFKSIFSFAVITPLWLSTRPST